MKVKLTFELDTVEDEYAISLLQNCEKMSGAMWRVQNDLKSIIKRYQDDDDDDEVETVDLSEVIDSLQSLYKEIRIPELKWE